jgi:hypothetical protein
VVLIWFYKAVCTECPFTVLQRGFHVEAGKGLVVQCPKPWEIVCRQGAYDVPQSFQFGNGILFVRKKLNV